MNLNEEASAATREAMREAIEYFTRPPEVEPVVGAPRAVKPHWRTLCDRQPFRNRGRAA